MRPWRRDGGLAKLIGQSITVRWMVPKRVIFVDELPKTMSGKIQRRRVLADLVPGADG